MLLDTAFRSQRNPTQTALNPADMNVRQLALCLAGGLHGTGQPVGQALLAPHGGVEEFDLGFHGRADRQQVRDVWGLALLTPGHVGQLRGHDQKTSELGEHASRMPDQSGGSRETPRIVRPLRCRPAKAPFHVWRPEGVAVGMFSDACYLGIQGTLAPTTSPSG